MDKREERWRELCAKAAVEYDPQKLLELVTEITRLLGEKYGRAQANPDEPSPESSGKASDT
ncbi:MAG: hypothetical protein DMG81_07020 [Acidobacteria bacterium]|nr:MAG: hypothetical protein DMG81_07020 [Acidobacteriota bacterium]